MKKLNIDKAKVLMISNQKGGVGKTDITHSTAYTFAEIFGYRVLVVDVCGQGNMTTNFGFVPGDKPGIAELLPLKQVKGKKGFFEIKRTNEFFNKGDVVETKSFIHDTKYKNLKLLPCSQEVYETQHEIFSNDGAAFLLHTKLETIKDQFDFIFIDTPPDLGTLVTNAVLAANFVVVMYLADNSALDTVSQMLETIYNIQDEEYLNKNDTTILGGVCNAFRVGNKDSVRTLNKWLEAVKKEDVFPYYFSNIPGSVEITNSKNRKLSIVERKPSHVLSQSIINFSKELHKRIKLELENE